MATATKPSKTNTAKIAASKPSKPTKTQQQTDADTTVQTVIKNFKASKDYVESSYWSQWESNWKVYNGQRVNRGYSGIADVTDPTVFPIVQASVASIAAGKPKFDYLPTKPEQRGDVKALNALIDYWWDCNDLSLRVIPWLKDVHIYGTGIMYVSWETDKPCVRPHPLRDTFPDPTCSSIDEIEQSDDGFIIRRYLSTKNALMGMETMDEEGNVSPMFSNLDQITSFKSDQQLDRDRKDMFMGSTLGSDAKRDQVEVLEHWTRKFVTVVANRTTVIRREANPFADKDGNGFLPFIIQRYDIDGSLFFGKSLVEVIAPQQELLNDLTNQDVDNTSYVNNNMWRIDPAYSDQKDQIESIPGAVYALPAGALEPLDKPIADRNMMNQRLAIKQSMREAASIDQTVQGISDSTNPTATEVNATQAGASRNFTLRLTMMENEGYKRLGVLLFNMIQRFVTEKQMVRIVGADGVDWKPLDPKNYEGDYEPRVQLDSTTQMQQEQNMKKYQTLYEALLDNPMVNQTELLELLIERSFDLDNDEVASLIGKDQDDQQGYGEQPDPNAPQQAPVAPGAPGMPMDAATAAAVPGATATPSGQVHETADMIKLYSIAQPDVQAQILQLLGLDPSQQPDPADVNAKVQLAMDVQKHQMSMEQAQAEMNNPGAANGTNTPAKASPAKA